MLTPDTYAAAARPRPARAPGGPRRHGDGPPARHLRGRQVRPGRHRLRGRPAPHRRHPRRARPGRPGGARASTGTSSSTSTRTSTGSSRPCSTSGSADRDDVCVVGDPAQTIYSFTGASPEHLLGFRTRHPRRPRRRAGAQLPLDARRSSGWPTSCCAARAAAGAPARSSCAPSATTAPSPSCSSPTTTPPRRTTSPRASRHSSTAGTPPSEVAVLFRTNGQSEAVRVGARRAGHPLPRPRRRALLLAQGGPRRHRPHARSGALRRRRGAPARPRARRAPRGRLDARGPARPAVPPASAGSPSRRSPPSPTTSSPPTPRPACPPSCASSRSGPPPSTHRPSRASPSPRCTPPRASSGAPSSSSAAPTG